MAPPRSKIAASANWSSPAAIFTRFWCHHPGFCSIRAADDVSLTRLLFYTALRNRKLSDRFFETYFEANLELLFDLVWKGIEKGQFRPVQPVVAARSFLGMIICHYLVQINIKRCPSESSPEK